MAILFMLRNAPGPSGGVGTIEATDLTPVQDSVNLTSLGAFSGVFVNNLASPVSIVDVTVVDDVNRTLQCGSKAEIVVPAGASFRADLVGCGERASGSEFKLNVRINYDVLDVKGNTQKTLTGVLSGVVD